MKCYDMQTYARNPEEIEELSPTVLAHWGTGGQCRVLAMDGDKWKPRKNLIRKGGCGIGINADGASYTLNTVDRHIVAILGEANDKEM